MSKTAKPISTTNVILMQDDDVQRVYSFRNTEAGNKAAREKFKDVVNDCERQGAQTDAYWEHLMDIMGEWSNDNGTCRVFLAHSHEA